MKGRRAVVVGAGIGGLAHAALLAKAGLRVTIFEKNGAVGGRCGGFSRDGYRFDTGASMFLMPEVFEEIFGLLGERVEDHLRLERVDPSCRVYFDDGERLDLTADHEVMRRQLEHLEPGAYAAFLRYLAEGAESYRISIPHFIKRNFDGPGDVVTPANLARLVRLRAWQSHAARVAHHFRHPWLRAFFTYQDMYVGLDPHRAPAIYSLFPYMELCGGLWYPRGGMEQIPLTFARIAESAGVEIVCDAPVRHVVADGTAVRGVELEAGDRIDADLVVLNADLPYAYRALLPDPRLSRRLQRKEYACSAVTFFLGIRRKLDALETQHSVFVAPDYRAGFAALFDPGARPTSFHFYVNAPAKTDAAAAAPGTETLQVIVPVANAHPGGGQDFEELKKRARAYVFERMRQLGMHRLEDSVACELSWTPEDWRRRLNLERGSTFGSLAHGLTQVGCFRPDNRHPRYRNLYFVGGSTRPGSGVPMVLISAMLTAERVAGGSWR